MTPYAPNEDRYKTPSLYRRCGRSGLLLPALSIGCWQNFGEAGTDSTRSGDEAAHDANCRAMLRTAFDHGITHFDLANNYGPPPGSAETRVGRILKTDFAAHRDELIISSKAGYNMWAGPYGSGGTRKHVLASLDASLKRLQLDYVDIFYSHRVDPNTPLEETMEALDQAVRSGKALYTGISNHLGDRTAEALAACREGGLTRPIINQPSYHMFNRTFETQLQPVVERFGMGVACFSPLSQGLLTDKYLKGIPTDSRVGRGQTFKAEQIEPWKLDKVRKLNDVAQERGQSLAQLALAWCLRLPAITTVIIGASRPQQIIDNLYALNAAPISAEENQRIDAILA